MEGGRSQQAARSEKGFVPGNVPKTRSGKQEVVGPARFERATCRLGGGCSIHLSYEPLTRDGRLATGTTQYRLILPDWCLASDEAESRNIR